MDISRRGVMELTPSKELAKTRKPYTITKQREKWSDEDHNKFLEAIGLYGRAWQRIQEHVGTKSAAQIRSHAQKFFLKLQKKVDDMNPGHPNGLDIPPPRVKRKSFHPSNEVKVNNSSECLAWPSTDQVIVDPKRKKPVAQATEESMNQAFRKCDSYVSVCYGNHSAYPLPEHLPIIESVKKTGKYLHLFEMDGNFTNPQMNLTSEERYQVLEKPDKPFSSPKHTLQCEGSYQNIVSPQSRGSQYPCTVISASFTENQDANADLNLLFSPTSSATYRTKDPAISSIHQVVPSTSLCDECLKDENASIALIGFTTASLLEQTSFMDFSDTNIYVGEDQDKHGDISSSIKDIVAATVEAATAWWTLNGLLPSHFQTNISSSAQTTVQNPTKESKDIESDSGAKENLKYRACSTLLEPSSSSLEAVEKIRVGRTEKPFNQYMISSVVKGNKAVNQVPGKEEDHPSSNTSPFTEAVNFGQLKNVERFSKPYNGSLAFEALFSQNVLPQSFGPLLMDDDKLDLNLGEKEALELQIDLNRETFNYNVCNSAEEEKASSLIMMPEECKDCAAE